MTNNQFKKLKVGSWITWDRKIYKIVEITAHLISIVQMIPHFDDYLETDKVMTFLSTVIAQYAEVYTPYEEETL